MLRGNYIFLCGTVLSIVCSVVYFAYNNQMIIIKNPFYIRHEKSDVIEHIMPQQKGIKHFFWHQDAWRQENVDILWSTQKVHALSSLITSWLTILDEEKINTKKISLQSIAISSNQQEVFFSFDRNPFNKQQSTFEKLLWIEGLMKSIRESGIKIQSIRFLVHHQPLTDTHLDFSNSWPIEGFLKE